MIPLTTLLDDVKCYEVLSSLHWPEGVTCQPVVAGEQTRARLHPARRKYRCRGCGRHFDDLTGTIFAGPHQSLMAWIGDLYLMGLNLSNLQIAHELGLNEDDAQRMTEQLCAGIVASQPTPMLSGEVECDEVCVVAGHKGHSDAVKKTAAAYAAQECDECRLPTHLRTSVINPSVPESGRSRPPDLAGSASRAERCEASVKPQTTDLPTRPASNGIIDRTRPMACDLRGAGSRKKKSDGGRASTPPPGFGPTADVLRQRGRIADISNLRGSSHLKLALTGYAGTQGTALVGPQPPPINPNRLLGDLCRAFGLSQKRTLTGEA